MSHFKLSNVIKTSEFKTATWLVLAFAIVVFIFPNRTVDAWNVLNPQKFGYLVLTLATIEFFGYLLTKSLGPSRGLLLVGFLGGFISSTAILISNAKKAVESPPHWRIYLASAIASKTAALVELLLIVGLVSPYLLKTVATSVVAPLIISGVAILMIARGNKKAFPEINMKSPLDWLGVLRLAILIAGIMALITFSKTWFGEDSTQILSFITGFFELHGVSLANATLFNQNQLTAKTAVQSIQIAIIGSLFAKTILSWTVAPGPFSRLLTFVFLMMMASVTATAFLQMGSF